MDQKGKTASIKAAKFLNSTENVKKDKLLPEDITYAHLLGQRIDIKWTKAQSSEPGWYAATIIDVDPQLDFKFWLRYDIADSDNDRFWPQKILGKNAPIHNWCLFESGKRIARKNNMYTDKELEVMKT